MGIGRAEEAGGVVKISEGHGSPSRRQNAADVEKSGIVLCVTVLASTLV
jgi:hypothetical protein